MKEKSLIGLVIKREYVCKQGRHNKPSPIPVKSSSNWHSFLHPLVMASTEVTANYIVCCYLYSNYRFDPSKSLGIKCKVKKKFLLTIKELFNKLNWHHHLSSLEQVNFFSTLQNEQNKIASNIVLFISCQMVPVQKPKI